MLESLMETQVPLTGILLGFASLFAFKKVYTLTKDFKSKSTIGAAMLIAGLTLIGFGFDGNRAPVEQPKMPIASTSQDASSTPVLVNTASPVISRYLPSQLAITTIFAGFGLALCGGITSIRAFAQGQNS